MSLQHAVRASSFTPVASVERVSVKPVSGALAASAASAKTTNEDDALEFVRFCYRRRRVAWPALYDEMSAVASRGAFRGMGYGELAERGISFCLNDLARLIALTERVIAEEHPVTEPTASFALKIAPAS